MPVYPGYPIICAWIHAYLCHIDMKQKILFTTISSFFRVGRFPFFWFPVDSLVRCPYIYVISRRIVGVGLPWAQEQRRSLHHILYLWNDKGWNSTRQDRIRYADKMYSVHARIMHIHTTHTFYHVSSDAFDMILFLQLRCGGSVSTRVISLSSSLSDMVSKRPRSSWGNAVPWSDDLWGWWKLPLILSLMLGSSPRLSSGRWGCFWCSLGGGSGVIMSCMAVVVWP